MTNAEKLAKDTEKLAKWLCSSTGMCEENDGNDCRTCRYSGICADTEDMKEWLESEVEEDAEIH